MNFKKIDKESEISLCGGAIVVIVHGISFKPTLFGTKMRSNPWEDKRICTARLFRNLK